MRLPKFRRFYFPGLISLIFLPVMCISYLIDSNAFYKPHGIEIEWASEQLVKKFHIETLRRYDTINITGDLRSDKMKISRMPGQLKLVFAKDNVKTGVVVNFGSRSNYAEFINIIDACFLDSNKGKFFAPFRNKLYIGHIDIRYPSQRQNYFLDDLIRNPRRPSISDFFSTDNFNRLLSKTSQFGKTYWAPILIFLLMLYFTFDKRRRLLDLKRLRFVGD